MCFTKQALNALRAIGRINPADSFRSPDFVQLARAYGIPARRPARIDELADALVAVPAGGAPQVIELPLGPIGASPRDGYGSDDG